MDRWIFSLINDVYQFSIGWIKKSQVSNSYDEDSS